DGTIQLDSDWETGLEIEYFPNGQKKSQTQWTKMQDCVIRDSTGKELVRWFGRQKDGLQTEWFQSGQKKSEGSWSQDRKQGKWICWYENGMKREEGNYSGGYYKKQQPVLSSDAIPDFIPYKDGVWEYCSSDGKRVNEQIWEKGKMLSEYFID